MGTQYQLNITKEQNDDNTQLMKSN